MAAFLEAKNIYKSFPGVEALSNVNLAVDKGEVHAIVGENGAGKSTLMKIFGGVHTPDHGDILLKGKKVNLRSVQASNQEGISVIFQEFNLMSELSVAENIFISRLPRVKFFGVLNIVTLNRRARDLLNKLNIDIRPSELVKNLSVSEKQIIEIVKAISIDADILIMDEPTAALSDDEVNKLYEIIEELKSLGTTILYVSHRLKEIFEIADKVSVLRDGKHVGTEHIKDIDQEAVVRMMVGRDIDKFYQVSHAKVGDTVISVDSLTKNDSFQEISFDLKKGEVLGIAGLMGCGREELLKSIYGLTRFDRGSVSIGGKELRISSPRDAMANGIAFVTEDRKESGIFSRMRVKENATINIIRNLSLLKGSFIQFSRENKIFREYVDYLNIKFAGNNQIAMNLSGGNQQKVVLARALMTECRVLLLLEPTRGVDVGAKLEIYNLIHDLASKGIGILIVSSDLPELISLSDRMLVLWQGRATGLLSKNEIDEEAIMLCATGNRNLVKVLKQS